MEEGKTDTIVSVGERIDCQYFQKRETIEGREEPWCTLFQIVPECTGDVNKCDVLMFAPDPRDGYR